MAKVDVQAIVIGSAIATTVSVIVTLILESVLRKRREQEEPVQLPQDASNDLRWPSS